MNRLVSIGSGRLLVSASRPPCLSTLRGGWVENLLVADLSAALLEESRRRACPRGIKEVWPAFFFPTPVCVGAWGIGCRSGDYCAEGGLSDVSGGRSTVI